MHDRFRPAWIAAVVMLAILWPASRGNGDETVLADHYAKQLTAVGIEPTEKGIRRYLESLLPDQDRWKFIRSLIVRLGSPNFKEREAATKRLLILRDAPIDELKAVSNSDDPEVRRRARRILGQIDKSRHESLLIAALSVIEGRQLEGFADILLKLLPLWEKTPRVTAARRALAATAGPADEWLLKTAIASSNRTIRLAAIQAWPAVGGLKAKTLLRELAADSDEGARLLVARSLAVLGDRSGLGLLLALTKSDKIGIRIEAAALLRALTGRRFGFVAYDEAAKRAVAIDAWTKWLDGEGAKVALKLPLKRDRIELGRTLLCVWSDKTLREIDATGKTLFEADGFTYIWGCHVARNGHRLAVDYTRKLVVEYDLAGQEVWRRDKLPGSPTNVERLADGNTLLALADTGKVIEVDRSGSITWEISLSGRPTTANRLPNGLTLVNLQNGKEVVEVDRAGKVVWRLTGLDQPHTAQRLPNGNVLVCEMSQGKVVEYNRAGKAVWSHAEFENPAQAQRLANGNTLVGDGNGLHEISPDHKRVRYVEGSRARFFHH
jgi:hypothetical protein